MTVFENVAFGLRRRGVATPEIGRLVGRMLELVRLGPLGPRYPRELSGGQQQRVALGRALVTEPRVLLLDEPLSNLDALLRDEMRVELKRLQERLGTTMIFVTHDQAEALILSDRVVVMEAGRVEQVGRPDEVYRRPATPFVARFLGRANFFAGTVAKVEASGVVIAMDGGLSVVVAPRSGLGAGQRVQVAIRQESIRLEPVGAADAGSGAVTAATGAHANRFPAKVVFHAFAGQSHHYVVQLADGREVRAVVVPLPTRPGLAGFHRREENERLNHLAHRYQKDATKFWSICDVNNAPAPAALAAHDLIGVPRKDGG